MFSATRGSFETRLSEIAKAPAGSESDSTSEKNSASLIAGGSAGGRHAATASISTHTNVRVMSAPGPLHHGGAPARPARVDSPHIRDVGCPPMQPDKRDVLYG